MTGTGTRFSYLFRQLGICVCIAAALGANVRSARAVVRISDGFGDADRNNDNQITFYDTDINDSGTWNDPNNAMDAALMSRNITEVTAATDPTDVGIIWSGIRSYDTTANIVKARLRIINDDVATGTETTSSIFHHGLALGVESRGSGSSFIGRFPQPVTLGANAGDKLVVSVDFRTWLESANPNSAAGGNGPLNELRWGLFQDTDHELGMSANAGLNGASVVWGKDDGRWFDGQPGAEGDKGIYANLGFGTNTSAPDTFDRIKWEYNLANINGTTNNGRIFEGSGVNDTPGLGGDTGTIASPGTNGVGGTIPSTNNDVAPVTLSIQYIRQADGTIEVADFVNGTEFLRDTIKTTDTGYNILGPPPDSFDYVAFRNATGDFDFVLDNFKVETFSAAGLAGDYNGDGKVDAADYVMWRKNPAGFGGDPAGYNTWRANFGAPGSGASADVVPEPASAILFLTGALVASASIARSAGRRNAY